MPSVIPGATNYHLSWDVLKLLVSSCIQAVAGDNFVDASAAFDAGAVEPSKFYLYADFLDDQPDMAGVVMADQDVMEAAQPVRRAAVQVLLRAADDPVAAGFTGKRWANQAAEAVASYIRQNTGENRTLVDLPSGRKILSFFEPKISQVGEDNAQRWVVMVSFTITYTEHETLGG